MILDFLHWGLKLAVVTTGLIGLALLLRRPLARYGGADAAYFIWALPFLRLFMPNITLSADSPGAYSPWALWPEYLNASDDINAALQGGDSPALGTAPAALTPAGGFDLSLMPPILIGLWIGIGALWLARQLYHHRRFWRVLNDVSQPVDDDIMALAEDAAAQMGLRHMPTVKIAPAAIGPLVSGLFKPLIILPHNFTQIYTQEEQFFALCHEAAHIRRYDLWAALGLLIFRAVHWYNPLVHYAARHFRIDQEAACDAFFLAKLKGRDDARLGYAKVLLKAERAAGPMSRQIQSFSLALAANDTPKRAQK